MRRAKHSGRVGRLVSPLVVVSVVLLGATGCSDEGADDAGSTSAVPDAERAEEALNAGLKLHAEGDLTAAAEEYEQTLELDPTNKFALYNLALIDEASGNYGLAEEKYREALESDPEYAPALFNLAILVTGSDPEEATSLYERVIEVDPKDASAWMNLGLLLRASGDEREGNAAVKRAVKLDPELTDPAT